MQIDRMPWASVAVRGRRFSAIFSGATRSTHYKMNHTIRFGERFIASRRRFLRAGKLWPSVTSSNGLDVIAAINSNPNLLRFTQTIPTERRTIR